MRWARRIHATSLAIAANPGERARQGALTAEEYTGGTFTISNLWMYGVESLYAIVNSP